LDSAALITKLKESQLQHVNQDIQEVWSTLIVIAILQNRFSDSSSQWSLLVQKAQKWSKQRIAALKISKSFDDLMKEVIQLLHSLKAL